MIERRHDQSLNDVVSVGVQPVFDVDIDMIRVFLFGLTLADPMPRVLQQKFHLFFCYLILLDAIHDLMIGVVSIRLSARSAPTVQIPYVTSVSAQEVKGE